MGHVHLECGSGEHEEETLEYGDWMVADFETWRPGTPRVRAPPATREARGGRAMGEGRGGRFPYRGGRTAGYGARSGARGVWKEKETRSEDSSGTKKRSSTDAGLSAQADEENDTATSPLKPPPPPQEPRLGQASAQKHLHLGDAAADQPIPPPPPQYQSPGEKEAAEEDDAQAG